MAYATVNDVKTYAIFKTEIGALSDPEIERLIQRASNVLDSRIGYSFKTATDPDVLFQLNVATVYLVDRLHLFGDKQVAESVILGVSQEDIMNYSYTVSKEKMHIFIEFATEYEAAVSNLIARSGLKLNIFSIGSGSPTLGRGDDPCG